jgi:lipopolysaccharide export system permease protein
MNLFARYLSKELLRGYALSAVILVGLFSLITLADELDNVNQGEYQTADAFMFTLLTALKQAYDLLPVIVLLGTVFALGMLAGSGQLVAIRALGASMRDLLGMVLRTALLIIAAALVLAQLGIPQLEARAYSMRAERMSAESSLFGAQGLWARDGFRFVNIREFDMGRVPRGISIYDFSRSAGLVTYTHADAAIIVDGEHWKLQNVWVKQIGGDKNSASFHAQLAWQSFLNSQQLGALSIPPESLAPTDLYRYVRDLQRRGQASERYRLALWRQLSVPLAAILMALIAIPVVTGSSRSSTAAKRIMQSSAVGLLFYLFSTAVSYLGLLAAASPAVTTMGPLLLLALAAWMMLRKLG